jgi:hypothetical protein
MNFRFFYSDFPCTMLFRNSPYKKYLYLHESQLIKMQELEQTWPTRGHKALEAL